MARALLLFDILRNGRGPLMIDGPGRPTIGLAALQQQAADLLIAQGLAGFSVDRLGVCLVPFSGEMTRPRQDDEPLPRTALGREHLPRPRRDLLANVPPEVRDRLPSAFTAAPCSVPVYEPTDRTTHPLGWGYDLMRFVPAAEAEGLPFVGQG